MTIAFVFVAMLLLVGTVLRKSVPAFGWLYIPASVIAGMVGLAVAQSGLQLQHDSLSPLATSLIDTLSSWPGWLVAVVFAGMLLHSKPASASESAGRVVRQGIMVWVIVLGETAVGLLAAWLFIIPFFEVPNSIGMLIETGFAGGHGTAAAMGEVFAHPTIKLEGGKDLGMLMATCGLVYGIVSGILWINIGARMGWVTKKQEAFKDKAGLKPIGYARIDGETIDPVLLQVVWLTLAFAIGLTMQHCVLWLAGWIDGMIAAGEQAEMAKEQLMKRLRVSSIADFPLFIYTLFGGLIVRKILQAVGWAERIDSESINRLTSVAMDILVVAAIASLNLQAVAAMIVPFLILFGCGCVWTAVCLLWIAKRLLPADRWFQLGLINYGMSTGTTATGFVLLRMIDPDLESGAAEDYALAAPLSAPFVGGGMITIALPLLVLERIPIAAVAIGMMLVVLGLFFAGRHLARKGNIDAK